MSVTAALPLTPAQQKTGMRNACLGQVMGGLHYWMICGSIGTLFIKALGGSDLATMIMGSLLSLSVIVQIPVSLQVAPSSGKRFMLRTWAAGGILTLLGALIPLLGQGAPVVWSVIVLFFIGITAQMAGGSFWFPLLYDVVPEERRGRFFGTMRMLWNFVLFAVMLGSGWFLGSAAPVWKFQAVLFVSTCMMLTRNLFVARIPEAVRPPSATGDDEPWQKTVKRILRRRPVVVFYLYFTFLQFCAAFFNLPMVLYMRELGLPVNANVAIFAFRILGVSAALSVAGRLVDRVGTKKVFLAAHIILCGVAFAITAIGIKGGPMVAPLLIGVFIVAGATLASADLASTATLFHLTPVKGRAFFMNLSRIMFMSGGALAPFTAGLVVRQVPDTWRLAVFGIQLGRFHVMFVAAGIALLAGSVLLYFVTDVAPQKDQGNGYR